MNDIPKVVFSDSLESADWAETTIASGELTEAVTRLKREQASGYGAGVNAGFANCGLPLGTRLHRDRASVRQPG
jgi:hypothetical protein